MVITSVDNKKIKEIKKLNDRKGRDETGYFLIEGLHLVNEAYMAGYLEELIVVDGEMVDIELPTTYVSENVLSSISNLTTPPSVLGICKKPLSKDIYGNKVLILDRIQDPGNLGTIIRSAVAFNVNTIILGDGCVDVYNPKVLRATQGLIFQINIVTGNLNNIITKLKLTHTILGTEVTGGTDINNYNSLKPYALIMGNEGQGMSNDLKLLCDELLYVKTNDLCESLNVSIACSILLHQLDK